MNAGNTNTFLHLTAGEQLESEHKQVLAGGLFNSQKKPKNRAISQAEINYIIDDFYSKNPGQDVMPADEMADFILDCVKSGKSFKPTEFDFTQKKGCKN